MFETIYTVSEVAERIGVSQNTLRNWERELSEHISIERDDNGVRVYTDEVIARLQKVAQLRESGLSLASIREVFAAFYTASESAAGKGGSSAGGPAMQFADFFEQRLADLSHRQVEELKGYIDQRLHTVSMIQNEILGEIQESRRQRHRRHGLLARLFQA